MSLINATISPILATFDDSRWISSEVCRASPSARSANGARTFDLTENFIDRCGQFLGGGGDRLDDRTDLRFKVVRPSRCSAVLRAVSDRCFSASLLGLQMLDTLHVVLKSLDRLGHCADFVAALGAGNGGHQIALSQSFHVVFDAAERLGN